MTTPQLNAAQVINEQIFEALADITTYPGPIGDGDLIPVHSAVRHFAQTTATEMVTYVDEDDTIIGATVLVNQHSPEVNNFGCAYEAAIMVTSSAHAEGTIQEIVAHNDEDEFIELVAQKIADMIDGIDFTAFNKQHGLI